MSHENKNDINVLVHKLKDFLTRDLLNNDDNDDDDNNNNNNNNNNKYFRISLSNLKMCSVAKIDIFSLDMLYEVFIKQFFYIIFTHKVNYTYRYVVVFILLFALTYKKSIAETWEENFGPLGFLVHSFKEFILFIL